MNMPAKVSAACRSCGERHDIEIWDRINVSDNPELKPKVKDGSLFVWECPHCGTSNLAHYMTLYHDPDAKIMIWCLPEGLFQESHIAALEDQLTGQEALSDYVLRRVEDVGSLIEKVNIFDSGLDDLTIELCKYVTKNELQDKGMPNPLSVESKLNLNNEEKADFSGASLKFFKIDGADHDIIFSFPKDGKMNILNVGFNVYEDCAAIIRRNPQIKPDSGFAKIDSTWVHKFFR